MTPLNVVNPCFGIIGKSSLAVDKVFDSYVCVSTKFVPPRITRLKPQTVTSVGIIISQNSQIIIVRKSKIISSVLQKISLIVIISECRHQKSGNAFGCYRKKCKRKSDRSRNVHNNHIRKSHYNFFSRNEL